MTNINISRGSLPSEDIQTNNPRLVNGFVNRENEIELLPALLKRFSIANPKAIFGSTFNDRVFVVTNDDVFYIESGVLNEVGSILNSSFAVRIYENVRNQLCIVNGLRAYVIDQQVSLAILELGAANGFTLTNPRDVFALDDIMVIVGGTDRKWTISDPNNALSWQSQIVETDRIMKDLTGVRALDNNLFIFGEGGVERWVPTPLRVTQDFPFTKDPSYRDENGLVSTASLVGENNELFYLSTKGRIRRIGLDGHSTINPPGIQQIIREFSDLDNSTGSYFYFNGLWHYQLSFPSNADSFLYSSSTRKWCESTDLLRGNFEDGDLCILSDGVYELTDDYSQAYKNILLQTDFFYPDKNDMGVRVRLNRVMLDLTQGKNETQDDQKVFLSLSKDNVAFGTTVGRFLSGVGKRLAQLRWYMNVPSNGFTLRFTGHFKSDITIKGCQAFFN